MDSNKPHIIPLVKIADRRGNLAVWQTGQSLPFDMCRAYWISDAPAGSRRYGHAYYTNAEVIVALSGSIEVSTEIAGEISHFTLSSPDKGLYIPPMTWREIYNFSTNAVTLVMASTLYDEVDYIRDKTQFDQLISDGQQ